MFASNSSRRVAPLMCRSAMRAAVHEAGLKLHLCLRCLAPLPRCQAPPPCCRLLLP